jgi:hypothetical protein
VDDNSQMLWRPDAGSTTPAPAGHAEASRAGWTVPRAVGLIENRRLAALTRAISFQAKRPTFARSSAIVRCASRVVATTWSSALRASVHHRRQLLLPKSKSVWFDRMMSAPVFCDVAELSRQRAVVLEPVRSGVAGVM